MLPRNALTAAFAATLATAVVAAAMDPDVRARQEAMGLMGGAMKRIVAMAEGEAGFDAATAERAFSRIAAKAARVPELFERRAIHDPESKAKRAIWESWEDFTARAEETRLAADAGIGVADLDTLRAAQAALIATCKACHKAYKE